MKKGLIIGLIILGVIILILLIFFLIRIFGFAPYDKYMFNKAIETGDVKYCFKILDYASTPGMTGNCVNLVAQKNDNFFVCEELRKRRMIFDLEDCYTAFAYYKDNLTLCDNFLASGIGCSKTLFETCKRTGCPTIRDYQ